MDPTNQALHRFLIDVDGNVNSWGLLWKLLSGSCVLKIDSFYQQWYYPQLKPWKHLIPIRKDLSNLFEALKWCQKNPEECAKIAESGQELAFNIVENMLNAQHLAVNTYIAQWM